MTQKDVKNAQKLAARIEQEVEQLEAYLEEIKKHQPEEHSRIHELKERVRHLTTATEETVSEQISHLWYEVKTLAGGAKGSVASAYDQVKGTAESAYDNIKGKAEGVMGSGKESYHNAKENVKDSWWSTKKSASNTWNDVFDSDDWNSYFNDKKEDALEWKNYLEHSAYHPKHWKEVLTGQYEQYRAPKPFIERQKWKLHKGADRVGGYLNGLKQSLFQGTTHSSNQDAVSAITGAFALYYLLYLLRSVYVTRQRTQIHYGDGSTDLTLVRSSGTPEPYSKVHDLRKRSNSEGSDAETNIAQVDQQALLKGVTQLQVQLHQLRTFTAIYPYVFGLLALMAHCVAFVPFVVLQVLSLGLIVAYNWQLGSSHGFSPVSAPLQVGLQATLAAIGGVALLQGLAMLAH